ncbi:MAG TPA: hypothetical protein VK934_09190 [Fimbriimonas sp.]|nr:hypothetical protein [Fimbriimonas sp.]
MNQLRTLLSYGVLTFIALGYLASQWAYLQGSSAEPGQLPKYAAYARAVDTPAIKYLSLAILLASLVLAVLPDREAKAE